MNRTIGLLLPFLVVALATAIVTSLRPRLTRVTRRTRLSRLTRGRSPQITPYSALAEAAQRLQSGSLDEVLPGLARVLAEGTSARSAVIWLVVGDQLEAAACYPLAPGDRPATVENLAVLLARPDTSHLVPVLDGSVLRAALAIHKPATSITPADRVLIQDVASGAGLLLRGVAQNIELAERVSRADDLAHQRQASRQRLSQAREVERRRLLGELSRITTGRLATVRALVATAHDGLDDPGEQALRSQAALAEARAELDELLERFRIIARGVYPAVLRAQGPAAALEELAADLPRPVALSADIDARLAWEIESGIYYAVAAVLNVLAAQPADEELTVHLRLVEGRLSARIEDPNPTMDVAQLRVALTDDTERLTALGGDLDCPAPDRPDENGGDDEPAALRLLAWLPDHLEPLLDLTGTRPALPRQP